MAGSVTSPANSNGESVDSLITSSGTTGLMKEAVPSTSKAVSGGVANVATHRIGTHADDATFTPASTEAVVVIGGFADDTSPDSVNEGDAGAVRMSLARALHVVVVADAAAVTSVNSAASSTSLLAANANRIGVTMHNTDANALFVKYGTSATTTTSYTVKIPSDGYWEMPNPIYRGAIEGIWAADGSGSVQITELT